MHQPRGLTFPDGSSPRAAPARRHQTLDGALAETSSRGHRARDEPATMKFVSSGNNNRGTATNRVQEPRRRIAHARKILSDLWSVPRVGSAWREARKDALGLATMPTRRSCRCRWLREGRKSRSSAAPTDRPRPRRACRPCARSPVAALLRAPLWEEAQEEGVASVAAHHLAAGVVLLLWWCG